jgi:Flp pilus assembly protein TadD
MDEGSGASDASELHPWDPHRAAKDVEVGDFYFKRKNYRAAEDRYREALYYKDNDAEATYRLAVCLEKMERPQEARQEFQRYLEILPHGPEAENAKKAIERLSEAKAQK